MYRVLAFIKARDDINEEQFIKYYEEQHSRLIMKLFPWIISYKRNYLPFSPAVVIGPRGNLPFDAITEIVFEDETGLDRMLESYGDKRVADAIAADEEHFMDRSKTVFISMGEENR